MKTKSDTIIDYLLITLGTALTALALIIFLNPAKLAPGGASGVAIILFHVTGISLSFWMFLVSVLLYFVGLAFFGKIYGLKTLLGTLLLSLFTFIFDLIFGVEGILDYSKDMSYWLSALYGGILSGIGMGLVFKAGANTGGTDIIAQVLAHLTHLKLGSALMIVDGAIIFASAFIFGIESALYAIFVVMLLSIVIDKAMMPMGTGYAKTVYVISDNLEEVNEYIVKELDRSGTIIDAEGLFLKTKRKMLMTVIPNKDISKVVRKVKESDPRAFLIIQDTIHVLGEGYKDLGSLPEM